VHVERKQCGTFDALLITKKFHVELHVENSWTAGITVAKDLVIRVNVESAQRHAESYESLGMYRYEISKD